MKVLVADDDEVMGYLLSSLLTAWGYEVTHVVDGEAAWNLLAADHSFTLAILDWMMPGLHGIDVVRRLRATAGRPYTYVLLLTGKSAKAELLEGLKAGCDDYLSKPFVAEELQARLLVGKRIVDLQSQLREALQLTEYKAAHDSLTGLLGRTAILEVAERELSRVKRRNGSLSLALIDIDHFKSINDSYGHLVGDAILVEVAKRMRSLIRDYDSLGRFGGEEFLYVAPDTSSDDALNACMRICRGLAANPIEVGKLSLPVTVSIGVANCDMSHDLASCIHAADTAMYSAKANGRNRVVLEALPPCADHSFLPFEGNNQCVY